MGICSLSPAMLTWASPHLQGDPSYTLNAGQTVAFKVKGTGQHAERVTDLADTIL